MGRLEDYKKYLNQVDAWNSYLVGHLKELGEAAYEQPTLEKMQKLLQRLHTAMGFVFRIQESLENAEKERWNIFSVCVNCEGQGCFLCSGTPQDTRRCKYCDETECDCYDDTEEAR